MAATRSARGYLSIADKLSHAFESYADRPCIGVRPSPQASFQWLSYSEVGSEALGLGAALRAQGAAPGNVVAICRQRDRWWYTYDFAAQLKGLVSVGLDNTSTYQSMLGVCEAIQPWCVIVDDTTFGQISRIAKEIATRDSARIRLLVYADERVALSPEHEESLAGSCTSVLTTDSLLSIARSLTTIKADSRQPHELATLICTSGSSGIPKAAALTDAVWARRVFQPRSDARAGSFPADSGGQKRWISFQPPFHTMDRKSVWEVIFVGGQVGIHQESHGKRMLWSDFQELQPDRIVASPAFWKQLQADWVIAGGTQEASAEILMRLGGKVHTGNVSGAKPSDSLIEFMSKHLGFKKRPGNNYSSTELHMVLSNGVVDSRNGVQVKLADVPGMYSVAEQQTGELLVNSPSMFSGYYRNSEATAKAIVEDEFGTKWYKTGDVARIVTYTSADKEVLEGRATPGEVVYAEFYNPDDTDVQRGNVRPGDGKTPKFEIVDRINNCVKMAHGEFINPEATEAKIEALTSELFDMVFVDARSGQERICLLALPAQAYAKMTSSELLAQVDAARSGAGGLESYEVPKGLIKLSVAEYETWQNEGLLTPLGKKVRGAIARRYEKELNALYDFQFQVQCQQRIDSPDLRDKLVGIIGLMIEADPEIIDNHTGHLNDLGLNSLSTARLSAILKEERFNSRSVSSMQIANMDIGGLVECIRTGEVKLHAQDELKHQMAVDSQIAEELRAKIASQSARDKLRTVFITGGTGALGAAIIAELLQKSDRKLNVMCLVRAASAEQAMQRLLPSVCAVARVAELSSEERSRLSVICGSLDTDMFGMEEAAYLKAASETDAIIHSAAVVNHVNPYAAHREANVKGTHRVLEFAMAGGSNAALHFISTSNVVLARKPSEPVLETMPLDMCPSVLKLNGYAQSKFVSELMCWNASASGLPVAIYRPGIVSSHTESGFCKPEDFYPRLLQAITAQKVYPTVDIAATFDMTPLDYVARGITGIALQSTAAEIVAGGKPLQDRVFHTIAKATHEVKFKTLVDGVRASGLCEPEEISFSDFCSRMERVPEFAPLLHELRAGGRCSVRWLDASQFERSISDLCLSMRPSEVTADVVSKCIQFCNKQSLRARY